MKKVTFYHSVLCPRCHVSGMMLSRALARHPDVEMARVELLTNRDRAREAGVTSVPTLLAENGQALKGVVLTPKKIDALLAALEEV